MNAALLPLVAVNKELMVLATGSGSLILSHVNDAGFWLSERVLRVGSGGNIQVLDRNGDDLIGVRLGVCDVARVGRSLGGFQFSVIRLRQGYIGHVGSRLSARLLCLRWVRNASVAPLGRVSAGEGSRGSPAKAGSPLAEFCCRVATPAPGRTENRRVRRSPWRSRKTDN
jgi:hypothetical protein